MIKYADTPRFSKSNMSNLIFLLSRDIRFLIAKLNAVFRQTKEYVHPRFVVHP